VLLLLAAVAAVLTRCDGAPGGPALPANAAAASSSCRERFADGIAPALLRTSLEQQTSSICYSGYAVLVSGLTRTPLWSAEVLTAAGVDAARQLQRVDEFHPDPHLVPGVRAELDDYRRSGFDRGHMSPSGDMATAQAQAESFSLANIVPQTAALNRGSWSSLESSVRRLAVRYGSAYVVTGPTFEGSELQSLKGRVTVPTETYKAVYVPGVGTSAWLATNDGNPVVRQVSVAALTAVAGIDPFPSLSPAMKASSTLPSFHHRQHREASYAE